jgi:hypothetical protein
MDCKKRGEAAARAGVIGELWIESSQGRKAKAAY